MLRKKADKIEAKVQKMKQFEEFLEKVKERNDEFTELKEILLRYNTLNESNLSLRKIQKDIQGDLDKVNENMTLIQKTKDTEIMSLNNEIAKQTKHLEKIDDKKSKLQAEAEEMISKKMGKTTETG